MDRRSFFRGLLGIALAPLASGIFQTLPVAAAVPQPLLLSATLDALYARTWEFYRDDIVQNTYTATPFYGWLRDRRS